MSKKNLVWIWTKKMSKGLFCLITSLLLIGVAYQCISTKIDEGKYLPLGKMVDIGGYRLHLNCTGDNGPTIVFDSGLGNNSLEWALVQPEIAKSNRVCSYDRAGYTWSDESPLKRTSQNIVEELRALLKNAEIPGPYILVGHSFGGFNALLYASKYPKEVAGVVLVDSSHEDLLKKTLQPNPHPGITLFLSYIGFLRLSAHLPQNKKALKNFPPDIQQMWIASLSTNQSVKTMTEERALFETSANQIKMAKINLKDLPLIVITAGKKMIPEETGLSQEQCDEFMTTWKLFQKDLVSRSSKGKQIIAENSGHQIPLEQPTIIVEAIQEIIKYSSKFTCEF